VTFSLILLSLIYLGGMCCSGDVTHTRCTELDGHSKWTFNTTGTGTGSCYHVLSASVVKSR